MRHARLLVVLVAALGVAGCGSSTSSTGSAEPGTLGAELGRSGPDVALIQGTSDYAVGPVRVTFLVIDSKSRSIERPRARVWVGPSLDRPPTTSTQAALEPIGIPGKSESATGGVTRIYVARVSQLGGQIVRCP